MIGTLVTIIIYVLILGLLYWLCTYLLGLFPLPEPMNRIIQAIIVVVFVLVLISILISVLGGGAYYHALPRF